MVRTLQDQKGVRALVVLGVDADDAASRLHSILATAAGATHRLRGIVAVGGDGLVHMALNAAVEHDLPLGIVPAGTGNDFARAVGLRTPTPDAAAATIVEALSPSELPRIDVGRLEDGPAFGCVLSAGFDATVNARANRLGRLGGRVRYPAAMLAELPRFRPVECVITVDGVEHSHSAMLIAIANGSSYGGGMQICPAASVTDGQLDVTVVSEIGVLELLRLFPRVYSGRHMEHPAAHAYRGGEVSVRFTGPAVPPVFADGEPMAEYVRSASISASVRPGALRLLVPGLP